MLDNGDPETPDWPSVPHVHRADGRTVRDRMPGIPAQPIGYDDAEDILKLYGIEGFFFLPHSILVPLGPHHYVTTPLVVISDEGDWGCSRLL